MTSELQSWIDSVPNGSTLSFGRVGSVGVTPGCYLVSSGTALLNITGRSDLTLAGNGSTFRQNYYPCDSRPIAIRPILGLYRNTSITVTNFIIEGPATCYGAWNEGDYGIMVQDGNAHIVFDGVTIRNTNGDGIAVYPMLATASGINTDVTFRNGALDNIGYHGITLEGVDGFTFTNNLVTRVGNFMDLEVDNHCDPYSSCFDANGNPTGAAQYNVTVDHNTFRQGLGGLWIEELQGCIPLKSLTVTNNNLTDGTVSPMIVLWGGSTDLLPGCPHAQGLTISGNSSTQDTSTGGGCEAGPINNPPGCPLLSIANYDDVTVTGNSVRVFDGDATYFPNTPWIPGVALCGVVGGNVRSNVFRNAWAPALVDEDCWGWGPNDGRPWHSSAISTCGNTYGVTDPVNGAPPNPQHDAACP